MKDFFSPKDFLTVLIAILALYIAYQQWKTNRYKVRMDLFERRIEVYEIIRKSIIDMLKNVDIQKTDLEELKKAVRYSKFLFNDKVNGFIKNLYDDYWKLTKMHDHLNRMPRNEQWDKLAGERELIINSMLSKLENLEIIFSEGMKLDKI